jgi:hypothetical protein
MKRIAVLLLWITSHSGAGGIDPPEVSSGSQPTTNLAPLPLKLPMPGLISWPDIPIAGPHIEPRPEKPRAPFLAPAGVTNVARNKRVTSSDPTPLAGTFALVTDGNKGAFDENVLEMHAGEQWVQIDLERECRIYAILIWHDFRYQRPIFRGVVLQAAEDPDFTTNVRTLFNNDYEKRQGADKQYFESEEGRLIDTKGITARYLRFYSNGNNMNPRNFYTEIEVYGF